MTNWTKTNWMKRIAGLAAVALLGLSLVARADDETKSDDTKTIQASDTAAITAAKDTTATVQGKVESAEWSKSGKVCTITFENAPGFMAAAFQKSKEKLDAAFGGDFAKQMVGATIKINGKLAAYGGHDDTFKDAMQVVIKTTGQITVVTPSTAPATQPAP